MAERRVVFQFGITYDTKAEVVEKIPEIVKEAITNQENTRFDRAHFKGFGASSLDFEVVYYVMNSDFNIYMDIQQSINLYLMRELESRNVNFAFPTMTLDFPKNSDLKLSFPERTSKNALQ